MADKNRKAFSSEADYFNLPLIKVVSFVLILRAAFLRVANMLISRLIAMIATLFKKR